MADPTPSGLVEQPSPFDVATTVQRLTAAIEAAGLTIFARIDHAEGARQAGLEMRPAVVLIYGHAKGGTPIMLAAPRTALDLPLRVLVRESEAGTVVSWHSMAPVLLAAGTPPALANRLDGAQNLLLKALQT